MGLTSRTLSALKWSYLSTFTNAGLQILVTAALARLLTPNAFGLVAMAIVVLRFGQYFAQVGVGQALVQKPEIDQRDIRSGFTSSVLLGLLFFAANWVLAPLLARLFHTPDLIPVLRAMGLQFVGNGLMVVPLALLRRNLEFKAIAIIELSTYAIAYAGLGIALAAMGYGVWALVVASLTQLFASVVLYYARVRHDLRPVLSWNHLSRLYSFGARVSLITFVEFLCFNLDTLWTGRFLGAAELGLYSRAFNLVGLPTEYVGSSLTRVLMPSFARIQHESRRISGAYLTALRLLVFVSLPPLWGLAVARHEVVAVLLGGQWMASVPVVAIFAVVAPLGLAAHFTGILLEAKARLNPKLLLRSVQAVLLFVLLTLLWHHGIVGIASAYAIAESAAIVAYLFVAVKNVPVDMRSLLGAYIPGLLTAIAVVASLFALHAGARALGAGDGLLLAAELAVGAAIMAGAAWGPYRGSVLASLRERMRIAREQRAETQAADLELELETRVDLPTP